MLTFSAALLPIDPNSDPKDRLEALTALKNGVIGHVERKELILNHPGLSSLVDIVSNPAATTEEESVALSTQAAMIIGALSLPTTEAVTILLRARAHVALIDRFESLSSPARHLQTHSNSVSKLLESLLRALKISLGHMVKVVGPRVWGTDVIGDGLVDAERKDVRLAWEEPVSGSEALPLSGKGKGKEVDDPSMMDVSATPSLKEMADEVLDSIYALDEENNPGPFLWHILSLLCTVVSFDSEHFTSLVTQARRIAESICGILSGTVRTSLQRQALLATTGKNDVLVSLVRLVGDENGNKVKEAAFDAISALVRDYPEAAWRAREISQDSLVGTLGECLHNDNAPLRLAAATLFTIMHKALSRLDSEMHLPAKEVIPFLLHLLENDPSSRSQSTFIFGSFSPSLLRPPNLQVKLILFHSCIQPAYLIADNAPYQNIAIQLDCFKTLRTVLESRLDSDQPYETDKSLQETARIHQGALLSIASICDSSEQNRHLLIASHLLPHIVSSLSHPFSSGVLASATHCIRALSRSVNVLRTALLDSGALEPIYELLKGGPKGDEVVKVCAAAAIANLVLEFSPMRNGLVRLGVVERLCGLVKENELVRMNALWALQNASYQSSTQLKKDMMAHLGWDNLATMLESTNDRTVEICLGILRNITCTSHLQTPVTGLLPSEMGEARMLSILEECMEKTRPEFIIHQAIFVIVNVTTADEPTRLAIMARNRLLRTIITHFHHSSDDIRSAAVWCIINLSHYDRTTYRRRIRRPVEVVSKLKAMGVEERLKEMTGDGCEDVRERVRDALESIRA